MSPEEKGAGEGRLKLGDQRGNGRGPTLFLRCRNALTMMKNDVRWLILRDQMIEGGVAVVYSKHF